ncbi:hypothetical protein Salat_2623100 [Sesamum alatum]|uniref:Reverse transcriptase zinc-binding domain-containing protein n=1 Tax=Sesamum alatum TaxID=300844 RepID=A0AAE2CAL0_9LAMI|nr:hypothetical protein Salat_2623100 [Sesamum alatum]
MRLRGSIMAITKNDGTTITSTEEVGHEFVAFFTSLLGTEAQTSSVDNDVFEWGLKLSSEQAQRGDSPLLQRLSQIRDRIVAAVGSPQAAKQLIETWASRKGLDTSKAYQYFRPKQARQPWQAMIWQAYIPPKFTFILWLGIRERFERVWSDIRKWLGINRHMSTILSAIKWLKKEKTGSSVQNKARLLALARTVYSLWRHRNEVIFEAKAPSTEGLVISIKITVLRILLSFFPQGTFAL